MTCKEFRSYLESSIPSGLRGSAKVSEHIRICAECRGRFEVQLEVARHLRIIHDSVPQVPASLDAAVLANYRQHITEKGARAYPVLLRRRIAPKALAWSVAGVAGLLMAEFLTFAVKRNANTTVAPHAVEWVQGPQSLNPSTTNTAVLEQNKIKPRTANADAPKVRRAQPAVSATATASLSDGFRSLMYCDQMSCAEAMQVIRVQLPNSFAEPMRTSASTNDVVFADVLVGPDGIARGIRIVE